MNYIPLRIYFSELSEVLDEKKLQRYLALISPHRQRQIYDMQFPIDQKLTLYAEILVRALACKIYTVKNSELTFLTNEYGKPQLKGFPRFQFNISHTRNAIAVVIDDMSVGIDIERIKKAEFNIVRRFFTKQEQDFILKNDVDQNKRFYEIWTQKESYIKCNGKGFAMPLNSFDITLENIQCRIYSFEKNGYIISVCGEKEIKRRYLEIKKLQESDFLELLSLL